MTFLCVVFYFFFCYIIFSFHWILHPLFIFDKIVSPMGTCVEIFVLHTATEWDEIGADGEEEHWVGRIRT